MRRQSEFDEVTKKACVSLGYEVTETSENGWLKPMRPNRRLGAVVDFRELRLQRHLDVFVIRTGVTACVDISGEFCEAGQSMCAWPLDDENSPPLYSKIWTRIACIELDGKKGTHLSNNALKRFDEIATELARKVAEAVQGPYANSLAEVIRRRPDDLVLSERFELSCLSVSVSDPSIGSSIEQLVATGQLYANQRDVETFQDFGNVRDLIELASIEGKVAQAFPVSDGAFAAGIYWATSSDKALRMAGIAYSPSYEFDGFADGLWRDAPSNVLGIIASNQFASVL